MTRLKEVPLEALRAELDEFEDRRPLLRLLAAILYKQGPSVPTLAAWFDVRPATVYAWFDRIESAESVHEAIHDDPRPGRPSKLSTAERRELLQLLRQSPGEVGYPGEAWTPESVADLIHERYDVDYSVRHVRRLMDEAADT